MRCTRLDKNKLEIRFIPAAITRCIIRNNGYILYIINEMLNDSLAHMYVMNERSDKVALEAGIVGDGHFLVSFG